MNCKHCNEDFNLDLRKPKLLPNCGHSICNKCIEMSRQKNKKEIFCAYDKISYCLSNDFNDNIYLLEQIKKIQQDQKKNNLTCEIHDRNIEVFCLDCKKEICTNCVLFGDHRDHSYEQLKTQNMIFEKKLEKYKFKLLKILSLLDDTDIFNIMEEIKNEKIDKIEKNFGLIKKLINEHEKEMKDIVLSSYDNYRINLNNFKNKVNLLNKKIDTYLEKKNFSQFFVNNKDKNDIKEIDFYLQKNDIKKPEELFDKKISIRFNNDIKKKISTFCKIRKIKELPNPSKLSEEEVNLLHENLGELLDETIIEKKPEKTENENKKKTFLSKKSTMTQNLPGDISPMTTSQISQVSNISSLSKNCPSLINKSGISKFTNNSLISNLSKITTNKKDFSSKSKKDISPFNLLTSSIPNENKFSGKENLENVCNSKIDGIEQHLKNAVKSNKNTLDISNRGIDDKLLTMVVKYIKSMSKLKHLKLDNNSLTENGFKILLKTLKDLKVESLSVSGNKMNKYAVDYLISFKKYNTIMKSVNICENNIDASNKNIKMKLLMLEQKEINVLL